MSTRDLLEEEKEQRDRHSRGGRAESPGFCPPTKIDQGLTAMVETRSARDYYKGYGGRTFIIMSHGTSRKLPLHRTRRLCSIQRRWFGSRSRSACNVKLFAALSAFLATKIGFVQQSISCVRSFSD